MTTPVTSPSGRSAVASSRSVGRDLLFLAAMAAVTLCGCGVLALLAGAIVVSYRAGQEPLGEAWAAITVGVGGLLAIAVVLIVLSRVTARVVWWLARGPLRGTGQPAVGLTPALSRQLGFTTALMALGSAVLASAVLLLLVAGIAISSPVLVRRGVYPVIGPLLLDRPWQAIVAAVLAIPVLLAGLLPLPALSRALRQTVIATLADREQQLDAALASTIASRARLSGAFDAERRRIERDLHDGVQPQLLRAAMTLSLALTQLPDHTPGRDDVVAAQVQLKQAAQTLRSLVRGVHPQTLTDRGIAAALEDTFDGLHPGITIVDFLQQRPPQAIETTLFFAVSELLTNAVKHAHAHTIRVELHKTADRVVATVTDDGTGGATVTRDGGLSGLRDRIEALGGSCHIDSPPNRGTTVTLELPE